MRDRRVKIKKIEAVVPEPAIAIVDRERCTIEFRDRGTFMAMLRHLAANDVDLFE
ncbi:MAG: hypothetical protein KBA61_08105 [Spirochaetes bacterium]|nr:hypothetical protein [Spirochaetota bacterium]